MEEVSNSSAVQEETLSQPESAAPQANPDQETVVQTSAPKEESKPDQQDKSWVKKLRKDRDEAIRKAQLQEELIRQLMTQAQPQQSPAKESVIQKVKAQEYISGEDFAAALKEQQEEMKRELEELKKQTAQYKSASHVADLKRKYEDFDEVVNPDTLALLKETDPESAAAIDSVTDLHKAALLAYKTIKANDLLEKVPDAKRAKEVEQKLEKNKKTIQSPQAFEKRPMAQAFRMPETKQEKQALFNEMTKYSQMAGGGY